MNRRTKVGIISGALIALSLTTCQNSYDETKSTANHNLTEPSVIKPFKKKSTEIEHNHTHESIEGTVVGMDDVSFLVGSNKKYFQNLHLKLGDGTIRKIINRDNWMYKPGDFVSCKYVPCKIASYKDIASVFNQAYKHKVENGAVNTDGVWCELVMTMQDLTKKN